MHELHEIGVSTEEDAPAGEVREALERKGVDRPYVNAAVFVSLEYAGMVVKLFMFRFEGAQFIDKIET